MRKEAFLTKVSSAQLSDRAEIIMVDCRVELVYYIIFHYHQRRIYREKDASNRQIEMLDGDATI